VAGDGADVEHVVAALPPRVSKPALQARGIRVGPPAAPPRPEPAPSGLDAVRTDSGYVLDSGKPLSQSILWELQQRYYSARGVDAWSSGEVPHYVTTNPTIAARYAELVFASMRDHARLGLRGERQVVIELGAGPGRFAFHFLRRLTALCEGMQWDHKFLYVMTDFAEENLSHWQTHPQLAPFFEAGLLDVALFDVSKSECLELRRSGETIAPGDLAVPPCVIANYVFDVTKQELLYFGENELHPCRVTLVTQADPATSDILTVLNGLRCEPEIEPASDPSYDVAEYNAILTDYRAIIRRNYLFFPIGALDCLRRLRRLSPRGAIVLVADMGGYGMAGFTDAPPLVHHGSISFDLDFQALARYCSAIGGLALFPKHRHENIGVCALLAVDDALAYKGFVTAFEENVGSFGPDDFFHVHTHVSRVLSGMTLQDIVAYLRLGRYDCDLLARCLPQLWQMLPTFSDDDRSLVLEIVARCWDHHFAVGEQRDLAFDLGLFFYDLDDYEEALRFFGRSAELCGVHAGTLYNAAACCRRLGDEQEELRLLRLFLASGVEDVVARERVLEIEAAAPSEEFAMDRN